MGTAFMSKGKGKNRTVFPIINRKGTSKNKFNNKINVHHKNDNSRFKVPTLPNDPPKADLDTVPKRESLADFRISRENFTVDFDDREDIQDVGVSSDFFSWSAGKEEVGTFLGRIKKSQITDQFIEDTKENPKIFEKFKKQWIENLGTGKIEVDKNDDGIYALSGDNNEWEHGGNEVESEEQFDDVFDNDEMDLTEEEKDKVKDKTFFTLSEYSYGDYLEEHGESDRRDILEVLKSSDDFSDLFDGLGTEEFEIQRLENVIFGKESAFRITIHEAIASLRKEGEISQKEDDN